MAEWVQKGVGVLVEPQGFDRVGNQTLERHAT